MLFHTQRRTLKTYRMAHVCYNDRSEIFDCLCDDVFVHPGDVVLVSVNGGERAATVLWLMIKNEKELCMPIKSYKSISRGSLVTFD